MTRRAVVSTTAGAPRPRIAEIPWVRSGPVAVAESPQMVPSRNLVVYGFTVRLTVPGTGNTVVELRKNGTAIATLTANAANPYVRADLTGVQLIGGKDNYSIAVTAGGAGASNLSGSIERAV